MLFLVLIGFLTVTSADKRCRGVYLDDKYYNLDIVKEGINKLHDLVINRHENAIYFTFEDLTEIPTRLLGHLDLYTNKASVIHGIRNATAVAIDQSYNKVYVGGADGLFKINDKKIPERLPIQDDIRHMHYNNGLYFTNNQGRAFKFEDGFASPVPELRGLEVEQFIFDNDNNIFFIRGKKLFTVKLGTRAVNTYERHEANAIATDIYSKAYLCASDGLYMYNKYKFIFDKIGNLPNIKALTFDKDNNPIYTVSDLIVKLRLSSIGCFED